MRVKVEFDPRKYFGKFVCEGQMISFTGTLLFARVMRNGTEMVFVDIDDTRQICGFERKYVTVTE